MSAARDVSAVRGVLRKRDRSQSSSPGEGTATPEAPRGKRRKTVAWRDGEELAHVVGCAESDVDRTPFDEPIRCGGCGLHCVGRMYACQLCARDDFALCAVCFAAHVRITAALADAGRDAERRESTDADSLVAAPDHVPTSPLTSSRPTAPCPDLAVHPPTNLGIRSDIDEILESAAAAAAAAEDDEPMDDDGEDEPEASVETMDDGGTEETHSSEGEEDLIELGDAGDGDGGGSGRRSSASTSTRPPRSCARGARTRRCWRRCWRRSAFDRRRGRARRRRRRRRRRTPRMRSGAPAR